MAAEAHHDSEVTVRDVTEGDLVWTPSDEEIASSSIVRYSRWLAERHGVDVDDYSALWRWSVDELNQFWLSLFEFERVISDEPPQLAIEGDRVEGASWFPGTRLNYVEHVFRERDQQAVALIAVDENSSSPVTWAELRSRVAGLAATLRGWGVREGDRVVGYLPNSEAAVVGLLATASLGAVWSVCSPDLGADGAVGRIAQLEPRVLLAVDGYLFGGRSFDRREQLSEIIHRVPSIEQLVLVEAIGVGAPETDIAVTRWDAAISPREPLTFTRVDFSAPLWVLFSSGTTGAPKGIVHSQGGILLEHLKTHDLLFDERPGDCFLYLGSTSWMVWNLMVSALLMGTTIVLVDGNVTYPSLLRPFEIAAEHRVTHLGVGAGLVHSAMKAGISPRAELDLSALRNISVTGSPLAVAGFAWLRDELGIWQSAASGGTDICSAFVGNAPNVATLAGRFQAIGLGVALESWDADGHPHLGEKGELVVTKPMPSMPIKFWGDATGERLHNSYFDTYPGVWRHGDFITIYPDGTSAIQGRSDAVLNRNGVRMGPADICAVAEQSDEVVETLVIGVERGERYDILMFVHATNGGSAELAAELQTTIRDRLSKRHVPDEVIFVDAIPHTRTGKKLEVPVKRLFQGESLASSVELSAVDDADTMRRFAELAERWTAMQESRSASSI
jgi:acetoacetyl-CoA synthetase